MQSRWHIISDTKFRSCKTPVPLHLKCAHTLPGKNLKINETDRDSILFTSRSLFVLNYEETVQLTDDRNQCNILCFIQDVEGGGGVSDQICRYIGDLSPVAPSTRALV